MRHRKRETFYPGTKTKLGTYHAWLWQDRRWQWVELNSLYFNHSSAGRTIHQSKHCYDELHSGPPYRTGGPLSIMDWQDNALELAQNGTYYSTGGTRKYVGGFVCGKNPALYLDEPSSYGSSGFDGGSSFGDASQYGARAWNMYKPGKAAAQFGVSLGELRDLPRMLRSTAETFHYMWKNMGGSSRSFGPKKVADAWLNTQFGWLPFLSDIRKFIKLQGTMESRIARLRRENGKWRRRGGVVDTVLDSDVVDENDHVSAHLPVLLTSMYPKGTGQMGNYTVTRELTSTAWFKAAFRYYIPDIGTVEWERKAKRRLYGLYVSPSLVWNLLPWSWLVDWCTDASEVLKSLDDNLAENLAAKYAYVMRTTEQRIVVKSRHELVQPLDHTWVSLMSRKTRARAHAFGFGSSPDNFTGRQWSILSALGISRLKYR